jgi:hypothetical protein
MRFTIFRLIFLLISWVSLCPNATAQDLDQKVYSNKVLGIKIEYRDADDFDDRSVVATQPSAWQKASIPQLKLTMKLPPGFSFNMQPLEKSFDIADCSRWLISDSAIVIMAPRSKHAGKSQAIVIYFTSSVFLHIAINEGFVLLDSNMHQIDFKDDDTSAINCAIENHSWGSLGREDMIEEASYLDGLHWKGIRGAKFTGYHDEKGYAGLQRVHSAFLVRRIADGCNIVCSYLDAQMQANPIRESDFYRIISTIKIAQ